MTIFDVISKTVYWQSIVISVIAGYTLLLLVWRRQKEATVRRWADIYSDLVVLALTDAMPPEDLARKIGLLPARAFLRREALRRVLQQHIEAIAGQEKINLILCYCKLGLANLDRDLCSSFFWWRRLEGITNLSRLSLKTSSTLFWEMRNDSNDLVANTALIALSSIQDPINNKSLLAEFRPAAFQMQNLLVQLGSNWARIYGPKFVMECLTTTTPGQVVKAFVAAVAETNAPEAGEVLVEWLGRAGDTASTDVIVYILRTLKTSGDPSTSYVAKVYFHHEDSDVRAEALDLWLRVTGGADDSALNKLMTDAALPIQRVWQLYRDKRAA